MPSKPIKRLVEADLGHMYSEQVEYPSFRITLDYQSVPAGKDASGKPVSPLVVLKTLATKLGLSVSQNQAASGQAGKLVATLSGSYDTGNGTARVTGQAEVTSAIN